MKPGDSRDADTIARTGPCAHFRLAAIRIFPSSDRVCGDLTFIVAVCRSPTARPQTEDIMAAKKAGSVFDISALFEQELKARNEDLRRQAAMSMLSKLRPSPRVTMAEFLDSLQQQREVWSAVLEMSAVDFAALIVGGPKTEAAKAAPEQTKRTRISEAQKNSLKGDCQRDWESGTA